VADHRLARHLDPLLYAGVDDMIRPDVEAAIRRAAEESGTDPAFALAVAERESAFNPNAHSSRTIHGLYQMRGDLRAKYGVGDTSDPYAQAKGWNAFIPDVRSDMKSVLGRDPTDSEAYLGHHFGAKRAARTLNMDPSTPVDAVFTPNEMAVNPHFARAGTIGNLNASVMGDIDKRMARFGGASTSPSSAEPADLSSFGEAIEAPAVSTAQAAPALDLSQFGTPV
jgi:hypothetical protein